MKRPLCLIIMWEALLGVISSVLCRNHMEYKNETSLYGWPVFNNDKDKKLKENVSLNDHKPYI